MPAYMSCSIATCRALGVVEVGGHVLLAGQERLGEAVPNIVLSYHASHVADAGKGRAADGERGKIGVLSRHSAWRKGVRSNLLAWSLSALVEHRVTTVGGVVASRYIEIDTGRRRNSTHVIRQVSPGKRGRVQAPAAQGQWVIVKEVLTSSWTACCLLTPPWPADPLVERQRPKSCRLAPSVWGRML